VKYFVPVNTKVVSVFVIDSIFGHTFSSLVIDSETQATLTFEAGVPINSAKDQTKEERVNLFF
jgi:hypothetical protein